MRRIDSRQRIVENNSKDGVPNSGWARLGTLRSKRAHFQLSELSARRLAAAAGALAVGSS